jgi:hypothetical protein
MEPWVLINCCWWVMVLATLLCLVAYHKSSQLCYSLQSTRLTSQDASPTLVVCPGLLPNMLPMVTSQALRIGLLGKQAW